MPERKTPGKKTTRAPARRRAAPVPIASAPSSHEIQAAAEGVVLNEHGDKVKFMGELYRVAEAIGSVPLLKFAFAADSGLNSASMQGMAAQYALLRDVIHADDWHRFEIDAIDKKAGPAELDQVVADALAVVFARPPVSPSDSSDGRSGTSRNLKESSPRKGTPPPEGYYSVDSLLDR